MKTQILLAAVLLSGCTSAPFLVATLPAEDLAAVSDYNLCRAAYSRHATRTLELEVRRRELDCSGHLAVAEARQAHALGVANYFNSSAFKAPVPQTQQTDCYLLGNVVRCRQY